MTQTFSIALLRRAALALLVGLLCGVAGAGFGLALSVVTALRLRLPWLILCLPMAGLAIVFAYRRLSLFPDPGTNAVLRASRGEESLRVRQAPLIVCATVLTHLCGGSVGREGAALQLGGALSSGVTRKLPLSSSDRTLAVQCGMAAGFAALFGTPLTAAVFALEVAKVGRFRPRQLFYTLLSAFAAFFTAQALGAEHESFPLPSLPPLSVGTLLSVLALAALGALMALVFCRALHGAHALSARFLRNPYLRAVLGGCAVIVLTVLVGDSTYSGSGATLIHRAVFSTLPPETFAVKLLFTALTLSSGFKGGEIVPMLSVGAAFGSLLGGVLSLPSGFAAAVGMTSLFAGCTKCPLAAILLTCELCGAHLLPFLPLAAALSFLLTGSESLYCSPND